MNTTKIQAQCFPGVLYPPFVYYLYIYCFPVIFVIGVVGNALNLVVLRSRPSLRLKANYFLSAMALADLCFLVVMLMINLPVFRPLASMRDFMKIYFQSKVTLTALANALLTSSGWFAVLVTVERLMAIKIPLHARLFWKKNKIICTIICVACLSVALQAHQFLWLVPAQWLLCSNRSISVDTLRQVRPHEMNLWTRAYMRLSLTLAPLLQVTVPFLLLASLNTMLLFYLKKGRCQHVLANNRKLQSTKICFRESKQPIYKQYQHQQARNEAKITVTVLAIVLSFLIFSLPSAVMYWLSISTNLLKSKNQLSGSMIAISFFNFLVAVNKTLNFALYCLLSASYRKQFWTIFACKSNATGKRLHDKPIVNSTQLNRINMDVIYLRPRGCQNAEELLCDDRYNR